VSVLIRTVAFPFLLSTLALLSGCASIYTLSESAYSDDTHNCGERYSIPRVYSGAVFDLYCLPAENVGFFCLIDLPMSLVIDTLALPYTITRQWREGVWYSQEECRRRLQMPEQLTSDQPDVSVHD
jgi:uncharacterized protein YceK